MEVRPNRATVLIVEDDQDIREMLAALIRDAGYQVTTAPDGERAVARAQDTPPDVVVLDWMLPGIDGEEVVRRLRDHGTPAIIIVSASHAITEHAQAVGTPYAVPKPFDIDVLLGMVATATAAPAAESA